MNFAFSHLFGVLDQRSLLWITEMMWLGFLDQLFMTPLHHLLWFRPCLLGSLVLPPFWSWFLLPFSFWDTLRSFLSHLLRFSLAVIGPSRLLHSSLLLFFFLVSCSRVYRGLPLRVLECIVFFFGNIIKSLKFDHVGGTKHERQELEAKGQDCV